MLSPVCQVFAIVAILLNNTFEYEVTKVMRDKEGRYIILDLDIVNLFTLTIANIYAPNTDDSNLYQQFFDHLVKTRASSLKTFGDWDTPLSVEDTYNYNVARHPKCRELINNFMLKESLVDIWIISNKTTEGFTWRSQRTLQNIKT